MKVRYSNPPIGCDPHTHVAKRYLILGKIYTVQYRKVRNFHTTYYLKGIPSAGFNSVMFEIVKEE